jgi:hypothetical protein
MNKDPRSEELEVTPDMLAAKLAEVVNQSVETAVRPLKEEIAELKERVAALEDRGS